MNSKKKPSNTTSTWTIISAFVELTDMQIIVLDKYVGESEKNIKAIFTRM